MSWSFWEDYNERNSDENTILKDCIHNIYRVYINNKCIGESRDIRKRILHKNHGYTKSQMKKFNNTSRLQELGYQISSRKWNVSQKKWETGEFVIIK